jgi:hypothetical protein
MPGGRSMSRALSSKGSTMGKYVVRHKVARVEFLGLARVEPNRVPPRIIRGCFVSGAIKFDVAASGFDEGKIVDLFIKVYDPVESHAFTSRASVTGPYYERYRFVNIGDTLLLWD